MPGDAAVPLPGCALAPAGWRASLCGAARAGDTSSRPSPASGETKARQTEGERGVASEATEQLPKPLNTHKEAIAENAECNLWYVRKPSVGFHGQARLVSACNGCCL